METFLNRVGNPVVRALLRSPLHGLLSRNVMLMTVTGRRSGRRFTLPVQYARRDEAVYVLSWPDRRWWRNLVGGAPVTLRLGGQTVVGAGDVLTGDDAEAAKAAFAGTALDRATRSRSDPVVVKVHDLRTTDEVVPV
jgi:deazaflavin-dependent oxidoreductase (nitroreductase family)